MRTLEHPLPLRRILFLTDIADIAGPRPPLNLIENANVFYVGRVEHPQLIWVLEEIVNLFYPPQMGVVTIDGLVKFRFEIVVGFNDVDPRVHQRCTTLRIQRHSVADPIMEFPAIVERCLRLTKMFQDVVVGGCTSVEFACTKASMNREDEGLYFECGLVVGTEFLRIWMLLLKYVVFEDVVIEEFVEPILDDTWIWNAGNIPLTDLLGFEGFLKRSRHAG
jgi:hypothetical protein